jgi:hypothetical protein
MQLGAVHLLGHWSTLMAKVYSIHSGCAALAIEVIITFIAPRFEYSTGVL